MAALATAAPLTVVLCLTIWHTPFPISEAVANFEDAASPRVWEIFLPTRAYYRPIYQFLLAMIWQHGGTLDTRLATIKLMHVVPVALLVVLLVRYLRPRTMVDAAAATLATAVLLGSPGFRDNLEIPLSYTIVGMPILLYLWMLVHQAPRRWHVPVAALLAIVAIGFKEQGLIVLPVVLVAWWTRAPGATRGMAITMTAIGVAYVALRLYGRSHWSPFEQSIGFGFSELQPSEAVARFGTLPLWIYAYNGASTIANVLFSDPTRGIFRVVKHVTEGGVEAWEIVEVASATAMTGVIAWWGTRALRAAVRDGWSEDSRVAVALAVALLASGVLSFNYSRDRLGGMALVLYAIAAYLAARHAAARAAVAGRLRFASTAALLMLLAAAWQIRAVATVELARVTSARNQMEWLDDLVERRIDFADRPVYLDIMRQMADRGANPDAPMQTRYPDWISRTLGLP